jgi:hypothetical protein
LFIFFHARGAVGVGRSPRVPVCPCRASGASVLTEPLVMLGAKVKKYFIFNKTFTNKIRATLIATPVK